jgi:putative transcriptional regulator
MGQHGGVDSPSTAGRLLISSPAMSDSNFDRTVIFILEHAAEGAIGVVVNRQSKVDVAEAMPEWVHLLSVPSVFFVGGPVAQGAVLALGRADAVESTEDFALVNHSVGVIDVSKGPTGIDVSLTELRLFTGYSGWSPGQLEQELSGGAWFVVDPEPSDPLTDEPETLWTRLLKRQEGIEAMENQDPKRHWLN